MDKAYLKVRTIHEAQSRIILYDMLINTGSERFLTSRKFVRYHNDEQRFVVIRDQELALVILGESATRRETFR